MPEVMIRRDTNGTLSVYVAKKDLEANVVSMEFDQPDKWGGALRLADGSGFYVEPMNAPPKLPMTVRAKRL